MKPETRPWAIVTGGSSGIGKACAAELLRRGCSVTLIARDTARLEQARNQLASLAPAAAVTIRSVDVRDSRRLTTTIHELIADHGAPHWLVCASGMARPGLFLDQALEDHVEHMETNYLGLVATVKAAAGAMAARGAGRVVLVSSGAAFSGIYGYAAYAPSKFAVRALAEVLRLELESSGVTITVACPPDTDTPQLHSEKLTKPAATSRITAGGGLMSAEKVAASIIRHAGRGHFFVGPGWRMRALYHAHSLIAPLFHLRQKYIIRYACDAHLCPPSLRDDPHRAASSDS